MKKLIICTDMEIHSDKNVLAGYYMAKTLDLKPVLYYIETVSPRIESVFHPQTIHTEYKYDSFWKKEFEANTLERIELQLSRLNLNKQSFEYKEYDGSISDGIDALKTNEDVDFLSIGGSHHGRIHRFFLNTFVEKTLFHLKKDVLVIKDDINAIKHMTYLMPYGGYVKSDLDKVIRIANATKAKVLIDSVVPIEYIGFNLEILVNESISREVLLNDLSNHHKIAEDELVHVTNILKQKGIECDYSLKLILNKSPGKTLNEIVTSESSDLVIMKPIDQIFEHLSTSSTTLDFLRNVKRNFYLLSKD